MDMQKIKLDLIHWLSELQDPSILRKLKAIKDQENQMSSEHKDLLNERMASYENDPKQAFDWDDVMSDIEKDL